MRFSSAGVPSYSTAHIWLTRVRGKASDQMCSECGGPAAEWAYDHTDPNELRSPKGKPYTLDFRRYRAMCCKCHRVYDRKNVCDSGHEYTEKNTYWRNGVRYCRECRRVYSNKYYHSTVKPNKQASKGAL